MQPSNPTLEVIREIPLYITPEYYHEVLNMIPIKEDDLQKCHTETFDQTNYELVKYLFNDTYNRYQHEETPEMLIKGLKKLNKLACDIPTYLTYSNFPSELREELMDILKKITELQVAFEKKIKELIEHKLSEEVEVMQKWQWNEGLARELFVELETLGNNYFQRHNYTQAEECYKDCLLLISTIINMCGRFDPGLQAEEKRLQNSFQIAQNSKLKQMANNPPKVQDNPKIKKMLEEIDTFTGINFPIFNTSDTVLSNMIQFSFDQPTYRDSEFSRPTQLLYSDVKLKRFPMIQMRKLDPLVLKPSNLTKCWQKNSALYAALTSIIYKNKETLKDVIYPRTPAYRIPLYNPYGKYIVKVYLNGAFRQITIDDFLIVPPSKQNNLELLNSEFEFFFSLIRKAFQKINRAGIKIDKDPSIYNWMLMGPSWIPEKVLLSPMHDKFHYFWDLVKKATKCGILVVRRKPSKQNPFMKRVFYNVHNILDLGNHRLLVMQNISQADGVTISEDLKFQVQDVGGNQQIYERVVERLKDEIKEENGMFITSYQKFLENFDYAYINWRATTPVMIPNVNFQPGLEPYLFNNCLALHRKDPLVVSNDYKFVSLITNPQFKVKITEQFEDTILWVLLQHHSAYTDYQKQLSFEVFPQRSTKVSLLSKRSCSIKSHYKKLVGQKFILAKLHLNQHHDGNNISIAMTYHSRSMKPDELKDNTEQVAYSLYFYSLHKIQVDELKNELAFTQTITTEVHKEISSNRNELGYVNCPQFSLQPKIDYPKQKFIFQIYVYPKAEHPLSFNIFDSSYFPNHQLIYGHSPLYTSTQEFPNFDFFEGEFIINPPDLTKLNIQVIPMHDKVPAKVPYDLILHSNLKCDFVEIPHDEQRFETYEFKGSWTHTNAGGSMEYYKANPKYLIHTFGNCWMRIQIISVGNPHLMTNASIYSCPFQPNEIPNFDIFSTTKLILTTTKEDFNGLKKISYTNDPWRQISEFSQVPGGNYILIPSILEAGVFGQYIVKIFCSSKFNFKEYHVCKE